MRKRLRALQKKQMKEKKTNNTDRFEQFELVSPAREYQNLQTSLFITVGTMRLLQRGDKYKKRKKGAVASQKGRTHMQ